MTVSSSAPKSQQPAFGQEALHEQAAVGAEAVPSREVLLREGNVDDFEFRRRLGNDKERVWWAAVSKSHSLEVTIQKMTGIDLATHREVLNSASVRSHFPQRILQQNDLTNKCWLNELELEKKPPPPEYRPPVRLLRCWQRAVAGIFFPLLFDASFHFFSLLLTHGRPCIGYASPCSRIFTQTASPR